jgi:hypothetical protein
MKCVVGEAMLSRIAGTNPLDNPTADGYFVHMHKKPWRYTL